MTLYSRLKLRAIGLGFTRLYTQFNVNKRERKILSLKNRFALTVKPSTAHKNRTP